MERKEEVKKSGPLDLDFEKLLPRHDDDDGDEEPLLPVVATTIVDDDGESEQNQRDGLRKMSDKGLQEAIVKLNGTLNKVCGNLADKGLKMRANIKRHEDELERRRLRLLAAKDDDGCEKFMKAEGPDFTSASDGVRQEASLPASQSLFTTCFSKKLDVKNTNSRTVNAFESAFSALGRCGGRKGQYKGKLSQKKQPMATLSSRQSPFQCPTNLSLDADKPVQLNNHKNGGHFPVGSSCTLEGKVSGFVSKKRKPSQVMSSNNGRPRNGKSVVLVDEEEPELSEPIELADEPDECIEDSKIYYPSSDDPESIEICGSDMECLKPQGYLSSTIMNFYIRYLQQNSPTWARHDYHFFNTYFYNKLKEAVSKKNDQEYFIKFRRWWKGVDIFHKAYILLPIHENVHWSLVIICIPDKKDESGPILLHLDSLRLHSSKDIFENIRSFLRKEWEYLNSKEAPSDLPIADRKRKSVRLRIDDKTISVPQQKNDCDCGLFVLYFMERFIDLAPQRLKKKDVTVFTNKWFKPEEASSMRTKVRNLLRDEFRNATRQNCVLDQDPLSSVGLQEERFGQTIDC